MDPVIYAADPRCLRNVFFVLDLFLLVRLNHQKVMPTQEHVHLLWNVVFLRRLTLLELFDLAV